MVTDLESYHSCAVPCGQIKPNGRAYAPGWCGVHVVQYQKNEGPAATSGGSGTSDYRIDVTIFDANQNLIGQAKTVDAPTGQAVNVDSKLPNVLEVTVGNVDSDPVKFAYGNQSWAYAVSSMDFPFFEESLAMTANAWLGRCSSLQFWPV